MLHVPPGSQIKLREALLPGMTANTLSLSAYGRPKRISFDRWFPLTILTLLAVLTVAYVVELNVVSRRGFQVRTLDTRLQTLREENRKLNIQLAELQSMTGIEDRIAALGLVPTADVQYLTVGPEPVARR